MRAYENQLGESNAIQEKKGCTMYSNVYGLSICYGLGSCNS